MLVHPCDNSFHWWLLRFDSGHQQIPGLEPTVFHASVPLFLSTWSNYPSLSCWYLPSIPPFFDYRPKCLFFLDQALYQAQLPQALYLSPLNEHLICS